MFYSFSTVKKEPRTGPSIGSSIARALGAESEQESADSKEKLLLAARKLFARHGFDGTTVRALAQEAGTNVCMVSYHFGGKDELYRACLDHYGRLRLGATEHLLEPCKSAAEFRIRLSIFLRNLIDSVATNPDVHRMISAELEKGLPNARSVFEDTLLVALKRLVEFFKDAQLAGIVRADLDGFHLASMVYSTVGYLSRIETITSRYFRMSLSDPAQRERTAEQLTDILVGGCLVSGE
jgi:AcrR family transcriptional regulator